MTSINDQPQENTGDGMVFGTNRSRLALAMDAAKTPEDKYTFQESTASFTRYNGVGVANPYGDGIDAYEPNTQLFTDYANAYNAVQDSKAADAAKAPTSTTVNIVGNTAPDTPMVDGSGQVQDFISKAMDLANRKVPYVWGGTGPNGVDCSGLIYYAANAAGIKWNRYRAVDYGKMGTAQTMDTARPGDIVYYDEPGGTDHVGIYLGGGMMIQAPTTGQSVKVSKIGNPTSIRRIFDDSLFGTMASPTGNAMTSYNGRVYNPSVGGVITGILQPFDSGPTITRTTPAGIGSTRPI